VRAAIGKRIEPFVWSAAIGIMLTVAPHSMAMAQDFGPWSADPHHPVIIESALPAKAHQANPYANIFGLAFMVWSDLLTRIDGPRCSHEPSCAAYARQAVTRHRLVPGLLMAINRLTRGAYSSAIRSLPLVLTPRGIKFLDRLPDNAF